MPKAPSNDEIHALAHRMKSELRSSISRTRAHTPAELRAEASRAIVARVLALDAMRAARRVALFRTLSHRGEVETGELDAELRARGARIAYPAIEPTTDADPDGAITRATMGFRWVADLANLRRGRGFDEPPPDAPVVSPGELDVIVVPGLAFDPRGHRVGYGAGLYDRALPRWPEATTVGVGFDFQLLVEIPAVDGDVPVDWIVTEKRTLRSER
jgi:5-formyltetrahydrofolate cyclo-ligase